MSNTVSMHKMFCGRPSTPQALPLFMLFKALLKSEFVKRIDCDSLGIIPSLSGITCLEEFVAFDTV